MRLSLVLAALLCFTTWMSVGHAIDGPVSSCCLGRSDTKVRFKQILSYTIQTDGVCQITAVVFLTKLRKRICSDPNSDWAKRTILKLDEEKKKEKALQEQGQTEEGLTSDITPTVSTTAVVFQTKPGVRIYSDPNSEEKAILKVDEEKKEVLQEKGQNEEGLTSDITPTVSTTAVMFQTTRGVRIISNPNSDRAKEAILKVDTEKKEVLLEKAQNEEGLTTDITPPESTTAVVFQTTRGVRICSDPNSEEKAILKVDEEKKGALQEQGQNEEGLTSDITPTVSTTSKKTPQKKGRHRRRRQRNKSMRWKKAQRKRP